MIIPSIDLQSGNAVQLVGGKEKKLDAGDPRPIAEKFARVGEIAVVDLDAAMGTGSNAEVMRELCAIADCRVGGGIRDIDTAIRWLDAGATKVVLGTAATPEILRELPRDRVVAALDTNHDEVMDHGWTRGTGRTINDKLAELREYAGGFLVTFIEREGRMEGIDLERAERIRNAAGDCELTVAGGVRDAGEIATLDRLGIDAQVGMALYTGAIDLADCLWACARSDRADGLVPTVVADERGTSLGLAYSSIESLRVAIEKGRGAYHSRSRGGLWVKGQTSGDTQRVRAVRLDCDRDAFLFRVEQGGGFCHKGTRTCFGARDASDGLGGLSRRLAAIRDQSTAGDSGSYTRRLLTEPGLLEAKLIEEARELGQATDPTHVCAETADVLYFALAAMARAGVTLEEVERELDRRARKVTRRPGDAKETA
ncbi:MAG: phosphoribosyl-ATP diphosphatase [Phycisphaerales bacterium JB037]